MSQQQQQQQQYTAAPAALAATSADAAIYDDRSASARTIARGGTRQPHYQAPTTSTALPAYANSEAETIRSAFTTGNYRMLKHLPTELRPHHVSEATLSRIEDNITSATFVAPYGSYRKLGGRGNDALFSTFDYKPEEYARPAELLSEERQRQEARRLAVNPLPFLYSTPRPLLLNGLAGAADPAENEKYLEPYEGAEDAARRAAFLANQGLLHGPFVPTTGARSVGADRVIRLKLPDIVSALMRALDADWADAAFQIYVDDDELIIVQFEVASVDNIKGLLAYMNMFVKTNQVVSEYGLSKLVELFGKEDGGHIYFALRPPWVRRRADESFYALHPEMAAGGAFQQQQGRAIGQGDERPALQQPEQLMLGPGSGSGSGSVAPSAAYPSHAAPSHQSALSAEERAQMSSLMASFDAGLQVRKPPAAAGSAAASGPATRF